MIKSARAWTEGKNLRIEVEAVVDGVEVKRKWTFYRASGSAVKGYAYTRADAPGGWETDIKRLQAISKVIFDRPGSLKSSNMQLQYTGGVLEYAITKMFIYFINCEILSL